MFEAKKKIVKQIVNVKSLIEDVAFRMKILIKSVERVCFVNPSIPYYYYISLIFSPSLGEETASVGYQMSSRKTYPCGYYASCFSLCLPKV